MKVREITLGTVNVRVELPDEFPDDQRIDLDLNLHGAHTIAQAETVIAALGGVEAFDTIKPSYTALHVRAGGHEDPLRGEITLFKPERTYTADDPYLVELRNRQKVAQAPDAASAA